MRVLFTTWAWQPHFYPMVPLGWAFAAAGHEVRVATQPALVDAVTRSGLAAVPVGRDFRFRESGPRDPAASVVDGDRARTWAAVTELTGDLVDAMVDGLVAAAEAWRPDLVVWDPLTLAGPIAARLVKVPDVELLWGPDFVTRVRRERIEAGHGDWVPELFAQHGAVPPEDERLSTFTVDPCPPSMRNGRPNGGVDRLAMRHIPYNGPVTVPPWVLDPPARPRICLTMGLTLARYVGGGPVDVPATLEALADLDVEVVVAAAPEQRQSLATVPPNARVLELFPLRLLLPGCRAIVHQSGAGTMFAAAYHGVPQLVTPWMADQLDNAELVDQAGVGLVRPAGSATPEVIRAGVLELLDNPRYCNAAERVRDEMLDQPPPSDVVGALERLV